MIPHLLEFISQSDGPEHFRWAMEVKVPNKKLAEQLGKRIARTLGDTTFQRATNWTPEPAYD